MQNSTCVDNFFLIWASPGLFLIYFIHYKAFYNFNYWRLLVNRWTFPRPSGSSAYGLDSTTGGSPGAPLLPGSTDSEWLPWHRARCRHDVHWCSFSFIEVGLSCGAEGKVEAEGEGEQSKFGRKRLRDSTQTGCVGIRIFCGRREVAWRVKWKGCVEIRTGVQSDLSKVEKSVRF